MTETPKAKTPKARTLSPFADDSAASAIGGLNVENGRDRLALYGSLDLTRDKAGLALARRLRALLDDVVGVLEADAHLPDALPPPEPPEQVRNPFG